MKTLNKYDYVNIGSIAFSIIGLILLLVGKNLSQAVGVGANLNLSPVMILGVVLVAAALCTAIIGSVVTEKYNLNKTTSTVALYLAVLLLMFALVFVVYTIVDPILHPVNG